jgi:alkaline phosphatase D
VQSHSISSPGFEAFLAGSPAAIQGFEQANQILIDDLHYIDASRRGFMEVEFTSSTATAQWKYVAGLTTETTATTIGRTATES